MDYIVSCFFISKKKLNLTIKNRNDSCDRSRSLPAMSNNRNGQTTNFSSDIETEYENPGIASASFHFILSGGVIKYGNSASSRRNGIS